MASAGPPSDPSENPEGRKAEDWDWGDWDATDGVGDDAPVEAATVEGEGRRTESRGRRTDGAEDVAAGTAAAPRTRPAAAVVLRRRIAAIGGGVLALLLVVLGATAIAGGGGSGDGSAKDRPAGGGMRELTGLAARATSDQVERAAAVAKYARIGRPIFCGAGRKPWVALTFDDGPGPLSPRWIALMAKQQVPMTLFRIGRNIPGNEEYVRVQRNLGWDAGSHTQNHPPLASLSPKDQRREIDEGNAASHGAVGRRPELFRPPYESHDAATDRIVERLGMVEVLWNVDTQDSLGTTTADQIVATAKKGMQPGSIILMHEVKPNTLAAMPRIIAALREKGLKPVTVTRMLASDGPSEAQLRKGYDGCPIDLTPGKASS